MRDAANRIARQNNGTVDIVLVMPSKDASSLGCRHVTHLRRYGVQLREVPWVIPPTLRWWPSHWWPGKPDGWCGPQDLVRLHVLGLEGYDAVAFYDQDVEFQGDVSAIFLCAASGAFISTTGGVEEPLNVGFFAVRPDSRLLRAAELFAEVANFSEKPSSLSPRGGWADSGFAPAGGYFVGAECGQGFFHTLLYKKSAPVLRALAAAGLPPAGVSALQVDRCVWNYQTGHQCRPAFDCGSVRAHHKPNGDVNTRDCKKLAFRRPQAVLPGSGDQADDDFRELRPGEVCVPQCVNVGENCKCKKPVKTVRVPGMVHSCEAVARNPSGDRFGVQAVDGSIVVTRTDSQGCWCDSELYVQCCVAPPAPPEPRHAVEGRGDVELAAPDAFTQPSLPRLRIGQACHDCCNDGERTVPCLDVEACAVAADEKASDARKFAFVLAHLGRPGWPWLSFVGSMRKRADALGADIVLLMLREDARGLGCRHRNLLLLYRVRLVEVDWALPPTLKWHPSYWWPGKPDGWCGPMDLIRLHALGLEEYSAVAFYDSDVEFQGDVSAIFRCASSGVVLTASGLMAPLNMGFFAARPDKRLLRAALLFAENASYDDRTGWAGSGFAPAGGSFVGAECGQGFFHTLFYKRTSGLARSALAAAGLGGHEAPAGVAAAQVDSCVWNYQTSQQCSPSFDCRLVRVHHKPAGAPTGRDCGKLATRADYVPDPSDASVDFAKSPAGPGSVGPACEQRCVHVGANCKCDGPNNVKSVEADGEIAHCDGQVLNSAGDRFSVSWRGATLTVQRTDAEACWCAEDLEVPCCVRPRKGSRVFRCLPGTNARELYIDRSTTFPCHGFLSYPRRLL
ncbi:unnamed protein product [Prorocentrum cordatum]|uniref:Nucleotide-diphospho-sugar transferase domain-containing protein n=1 Tax=Prorocentrum cordatum TaxID=2364126 RepID=A0ABN9QVN0_9DINO|nr:unnamed protein product [Polarella glacialis]